MDDAAEKRDRLLATDPYARGTPDRFVFARRRFSVSEITGTLRPFLTDERAARIEEVLAGRTRTVVPVVEGLVNMGNVSAVMRSAEALGYQDFHVITDGQSFKDSRRTSQGAEKWLDVFQWPTAADGAAFLKSRGYHVVAAHLNEDAIPIDELDFTNPTALVFGNERDGVSEKMMELADEMMVVPMAGFVQSFNISVAAAVALYHAYRDRIARTGFHGDLSDDELDELRAAYFLRSVRRAPEILEKSVERNP